MLLYLVGIAVLFIALLVTIGVALFYFGIFDEVKVSTGPSPFAFADAEVAYKLGKGTPADSGALFTEVCSIVPGKTTVGIYLELEKPDANNPTAERKIRWKAFSAEFSPGSNDCHFFIGVITSSIDSSSGKRNPTISQQERELLLQKGFNFTHLPASDNVVFSQFPFRGIVSVVIGLRRVYPALLQYILVSFCLLKPFLSTSLMYR